MFTWPIFRRSKVSDGTVKLTDLPVEILEQIFSFVPSLEQVHRLSKVCSKFNVVCSTVLRASYRELETTLHRDVALLQLSFIEIVLGERPPGFKKRMTSLSKCIFQLNTIHYSFGLAKATMWSQCGSGDFCSQCDGKLVDACYKVRNQIMASPKREPGSKVAHSRMFRRCVKLAATKIHALQPKTQSTANEKKDDNLGRISFVQVLLCSKGIKIKGPILTWDETGNKLVNMTLSVCLKCCCLPIYRTQREYLDSTEEDIVQKILARLVWNSDIEI